MSRLSRLAMIGVVCGLAFRCGGDPLAPPAPADDPIAHDLRAWQTQATNNPRTDELWSSLKPGVVAALDAADRALTAGRRWTALERLSAARANIVAEQYVAGLPAAARKDVPGFEAEWTRQGAALATALAAPQAAALSDIQPAAVRALAEAAAFQVKVLYDASLVYGRATDADSGLFYLGSAQAQQQFVTFARSMSPGRAAPQPRVRAIAQETDALESTLLGLYRPPVSIDRHSEFIGANSALKEAKELDEAGLHYGALQRYLLAAMRVALLQQASPQEASVTRTQLMALEPKLMAGGMDHTIGRMYLERALTELDRPEPTPVGLSLARAVASDVLPKYFAALETAPPPAAMATAQVTVTLVRWPFT